MMVIDRFEGEIAVCECDGQMTAIARSALPAQAVEGDVLTRLEDGSLAIDLTATANRHSSIKSRFKALTSCRRTP
jgi:hypothetical protein